MPLKNYALAIVLLAGTTAVKAAETVVTPGLGTLAAAVAAASNGDTLVLQEGGYDGDVSIGKSLNIRSEKPGVSARVYGDVTIDGTGIRVTLQGLSFAATVWLNQAAAIRLLENRWMGLGHLQAYLYKSSEGDGSLVVVGNRFAAGSSIVSINSDGAYIAGNELLNGQISASSSAWIVGNKVSISNYSSAAIDAGGMTKSRILANRARCYLGNGFCISATQTDNLIAGNLVEVGLEQSAPGNVAQRGIYAGGIGQSIVLNNLIRAFPLPDGFVRSGAGIHVESPSARVAGNIVLDWVSNSNTPIAVTSDSRDVSYNLCHNNSGNCPTGSGNLNADPLLVDLTDYSLNAGSPGIDAGPPDDGLADLNRTRNDLGIHGGPWAIDQYDRQRASDNIAPFVYPLFELGSNLSGSLLDIQALGVARMR